LRFLLIEANVIHPVSAAIARLNDSSARWMTIRQSTSHSSRHWSRDRRHLMLKPETKHALVEACPTMLFEQFDDGE
jgi:hypothetical protein